MGVIQERVEYGTINFAIRMGGVVGCNVVSVKGREGGCEGKTNERR